MLGLGSSIVTQDSVAATIGSRLDTFLLDTYTGAAAAYSLRKLSNSYTGSAIRVRRQSDNAEQDVKFDSNNELDTAALATFCAGTNGFVTTWYDQSGNGNDATQTIAIANQPKIYDSVTGVELNPDNSVPSVLSSDTTFLGFTRVSDIRSVFVAGRTTALARKENFILGDSTNYDYHSGNNTNLWLDPTVTTNSDVVGGNNYLNGVLTNFGTTARTVGTHLLSLIHLSSSGRANRITADRSGSRAWEGHLQEVIIYPSDQSSNRTDIETNINDFYSIY